MKFDQLSIATMFKRTWFPYHAFYICSFFEQKFIKSSYIHRTYMSLIGVVIYFHIFINIRFAFMYLFTGPLPRI